MLMNRGNATTTRFITVDRHETLIVTDVRWRVLLSRVVLIVAIGSSIQLGCPSDDSTHLEDLTLDQESERDILDDESIDDLLDLPLDRAQDPGLIDAHDDVDTERIDLIDTSEPDLAQDRSEDPDVTLDLETPKDGDDLLGDGDLDTYDPLDVTLDSPTDVVDSTCHWAAEDTSSGEVTFDGDASPEGESPTSVTLRNQLHAIEIASGGTWGDLEPAMRFAARYQLARPNEIQDALYRWFLDEIGADRLSQLHYTPNASYYGTEIRPRWLLPETDATITEIYRIQPVLYTPSRLTTEADRTLYVEHAMTYWEDGVVDHCDAGSDICVQHPECCGIGPFDACHACEIEHTDWNTSNPHDGQPWFSDDDDFTASTLMYDFMWENIQAYFFEVADGTLLEVMPLAIHVVDGGGWHLWMPESGDPNPLMNNGIRFLREDLVGGCQLPPYVCDVEWSGMYETGRVSLNFGVVGGGGWAGAVMFPGFGGTDLVGEIALYCVTPRRYDGFAEHVYPNSVPAGGYIGCGFLEAAGTVAHEMGHTLGLPHPGELGCYNLSDQLLMQTHYTYTGWNANAGITSNWGILDDRSECSVPSVYEVSTVAHQRLYGSDVIYTSEIEVLEANPQHHDGSELSNPAVLVEGTAFEAVYNRTETQLTVGVLNTGIASWGMPQTTTLLGSISLEAFDVDTSSSVGVLTLEGRAGHGFIGIFSATLSEALDENTLLRFEIVVDTGADPIVVQVGTVQIIDT